MEKQKTKLGARILSTEELNAILPNAESVYEQIAIFRDSIPDGTEAENGGQYEMEQKTNNIGIMGCRGAGKTSVLKTFYHHLNNENENGDIILPIMIPENMSAGTTLMDAVLGRMKSIVEEREREAEEYQYKGDCIYAGRASLEKQYNELVKQYCYIKKDYRDILIQEFTTEQNYVDKTKKVFGSDSEFIKLFHRFVDSLLRDGKEADADETPKEPMLFLFIDDVDLSANRCMDIARTLLVYLSHPRIVTFISGDMRTFEEEMTLEFLRQEGALREDVFRETYYALNGYSARSSLLERKKTLAYDYLKKIIPPAYRKTIRYWALEERGNYRIAGDKGGDAKSLAGLLAEVTKEKCGDSYFGYNEDGERKCMRLAFHMLDDTARGLNNVYNVLQEIHDARTKETDMTQEQETLLFWRLIGTMVDSKPLYAGYKTELLTQVIVLGQDGVKIDFDNAYQLLYGEEDEKEEGNASQRKEPGKGKTEKAKEKSAAQKQEPGKKEPEAGRGTKKYAQRFEAKERFAIFYLIDFAFSLFFQEQYDMDDATKYQNLERKVIQEYLSDETIDDKIGQKRELIACVADEEAVKGFQDDSVQKILLDLINGDIFCIALHLIRCLGREEIYEILHPGRSWGDDRPKAYKIAYAFWRAVQAMSTTEEELQENLVYLYSSMEKTMLSLLGKLSLNPWMVYGRQLTYGSNIIVGGMLFINDGKYGTDLAKMSFWNIEEYMSDDKTCPWFFNDCLWAEYESQSAVYWLYYENKLREILHNGWRRKSEFSIQENAKEMLQNGITKTIMQLLQEHGAMDRFEVRALEDVGYHGLLKGRDEKERNEIQVIGQIDKRGLWDSAYVMRTVYRYLVKKRDDLARGMSQSRVIFDATQFVTESYAALVGCYKGSSGKAIIYGLESKIRSVLFLSMREGHPEQKRFSDGKYYLRLEQALVIRCLLEEFLRIHERVFYGKKEARKLLMEVKELPLLLHTKKWETVDAELRKREEGFFTGNPYLLRSPAAKETEESDKGKAAIKNIRERWYDAPDGKSNAMEDLIKEHLGGAEKGDYRYFRYLVQKSQIAKMKEEWEGKEEADWGKIEPSIPEQEYVFFFHSYMRYLQVNDSDAKNAGVRAEEIARLAAYMLDGEIKADEAVQNEFYQKISEELALTEEEFEKLF